MHAKKIAMYFLLSGFIFLVTSTIPKNIAKVINGNRENGPNWFRLPRIEINNSGANNPTNIVLKFVFKSFKNPKTKNGKKIYRYFSNSTYPTLSLGWFEKKYKLRSAAS